MTKTPKKKMEHKAKGHRHKWVEHDCFCPHCDKAGESECKGCGKWKDETGKVWDF